MKIWQVARAATAAPFYFKEKVFSPNGSNEKVHYSDGGFGSTNNPTAVAIQEIRLHHGNDKVGAIVSIGTAKSDNDAGGQGARDHVERAFDTATNPSQVHVTVLNQDRPNYWRLNDEKGLAMPLDHWKPTYTGKPGSHTMQTIKQKFAEWVRNRDVVDLLDKCASELVRRRRARTHLIHHWERFATGASSFKCRDQGCSSEHESFYHRGRFLEHWEEVHEQSDEFREPSFTKWSYQARS